MCDDHLVVVIKGGNVTWCSPDLLMILLNLVMVLLNNVDDAFECCLMPTWTRIRYCELLMVGTTNLQLYHVI